MRISPLIYRRKGFYPWDLVAAAYLVCPELFVTEEIRLSIRTRGIGRGKVNANNTGDLPYATVVVDLNVDGFWRLYFNKMS